MPSTAAALTPSMPSLLIAAANVATVVPSVVTVEPLIVTDSEVTIVGLVAVPVTTGCVDDHEASLVAESAEPTLTQVFDLVL